MKTPQFKSTLPALALGILSIAATAQATLITPNPALQPIGGVYDGTNVFAIYGNFALEFTLTLARHTVIADNLKLQQGTDQQDTFFSTFDANLKVTQNGITVQNGPIQANGLDTTVVHNRYPGGGAELLTGTFQTEMLAMNLSGGTLPPGVQIRESPTLQSTGQTTTTNIGGGLYQIDSFFDVFTELSIDGGQTWMPDTAGAPGHIAVVPEPASVSLLAAGFVGMVGLARRRRAALA